MWTGSGNYGANSTTDQLEPLFSAKHLPRLTHLGLINSELSVEVVTALACLWLPATQRPEKASQVPYGAALKRLFGRRGFLPFLAVIFLAHSASVVQIASRFILRDL